MAKKKKVISDSNKEVAPKQKDENICKCCLEKGKRVTMTSKGIKHVECPKCHAWKLRAGCVE